ncbi:MAG TPA: DUF4240 domain-containing protein [Geminicoccaceae bacterium]
MSETDPPFEWLRSFEPRFDSLSKDQDRALDLIVELSDAGEIAPGAGQSLYGAFAIDCFQWLERRYFERRLYDAIENVHTGSGEQAIGWPHRGTLEVCEKLLAVGEKARARRLWRHHLALIKDTYWHTITHRDRQRRALARSGGTAEAGFEQFVATIPAEKALLLEVMAGARAFLVRADASEAELKRLDRDMTDIEAEKRSLPEGKPDPRAMTEDVFWEVVESDRAGTIGERLEALPGRLARFKPRAIRDFAAILRERWDAAYRSDVWALGYLLRGGCSDDSFMDFRAWLIMQGRDVFEGALADADGFDVGLFRSDSNGCLTLLEAPSVAYELRTGGVMPRPRGRPVELKGPTIDEDAFEAFLPRVAAAIRGA